MKILIIVLFAVLTATTSNAQSANVDSVLLICKNEAMASLRKVVEKDYGNPTESKKKAIKIASLTRYEARVNYLDKKLANDLPSTAPNLEPYTKAILDEYREMLPELDNDFYERVTERIRNQQ